MRWLRPFVLALAFSLTLGGIFLAGYAMGDQRGRSAGTQVSDFDLLWRVRDVLNQEFLGEIPTSQAQVYGAAHGLVEAYKDRFTLFVEPASREVERDELRGQFGGIGASMARSDTGDLVVTVMRDRPAARAGIQDGDILLAVDGTPVKPEMTMQEVVALVRGEVGSKVSLTLRRSGQSEPFTIILVRELIETPSVEWRMLDQTQHIGYTRISIFGERTSQELQAALAELASQGADKLVLDLRGNGGGLVDAAVDVTSQFLHDGIVLREVKRGGQERFYPVNAVKSAAQDWQIALLVDAGTASASEIVAGALRDHGRAVLIGEKTFGKGSVQEVHEFPDGSSLHVTVARWLTPNRSEIDKIGLTPDVTVEVTQADRDAGRDPQLARAQTWLQGQR